MVSKGEGTLEGAREHSVRVAHETVSVDHDITGAVHGEVGSVASVEGEHGGSTALDRKGRALGVNANQKAEENQGDDPVGKSGSGEGKIKEATEQREQREEAMLAAA